LYSVQGSSAPVVVISTDMLAYGGLAGSRVPRVLEADARRRLDALARLKQRRPDLRVYAFDPVSGAFQEMLPETTGRSKFDDFTILIVVGFTVTDVDDPLPPSP
jgi:hypothetical protein